MRSKLLHLDKFTLAGVNYYGDPLSTKGGWDEENEIGKTWQRFLAYISCHETRDYKLDSPYLYELHIYNANTSKNGVFEVFIGEESSTSDIPLTLSSKQIPEGDYICCTLVGEEIIKDWWRDIETYVKKEYQKNLNGDFLIQRYDERFKGMDRIEESELDVLILLEV